jgi:putrescine importer
VPIVPMWVWVVGSVIAVTALNVLGIKVVTGVNLTVVVFQFLFVAVFVVLSLFKLAGSGDAPSPVAPFMSDGMDMQAVVAGSAILALSFLGFDAVSTLSEETHNPTIRVPRAIMLCALAGGAIYIIQSYVGHLVFPDYTAFQNVDVATVDVMKSVGGDLLNTFFTATYVTAVLACAAASQASVSRILYAMGRDGVLPQRVFGRLHRRYHTPAMANFVVGFFGLSALFVSLTNASSMISFGALAAFSMVNLAVIKYYVIDRGHRSSGEVVRYLLVPGVGVAFTVYLWTSLSGLTFQIGLGWLGVGFVYLLVLTRGLTKQPPALDMGEADMDCVRETPPGQSQHST